MNEVTAKIWIWYQHNRLCKAVYNETDNSLCMYNENDEIIMKQKHISPELLKKIEMFFIKRNAKRIDQGKDPFVFL